MQGEKDTKEQEAGSLVWVQYQRFAKRSEGVRACRQVRFPRLSPNRPSEGGIADQIRPSKEHGSVVLFDLLVCIAACCCPREAAIVLVDVQTRYRFQVFLRARKSPAAGWRVYAASARLEWGGDKNEKVPSCDLFLL